MATRQVNPRREGEFSGGPGLIDPIARAERVLEPHQVLLEIYATDPDPKFDDEGVRIDNPLAEPENAILERP